MTGYRWSSWDGTDYTDEEVENMTPSERMTHFSKLYGGKLDFTREGIEQLQEDMITFLDQFDEMPQGLVDDMCQAIVNYYNKNRSMTLPNIRRIRSNVFSDVSTPRTTKKIPLNPSGDHKTI